MRMPANLIRSAILLLALLAPAAATAQQGADPAIREVIESQLQAFRADDMERAYSYAAPNIRQLFPDPGLFMAMVIQGYPQVYRAQRYEFVGAEPMPDGRIGQLVAIRGPDGSDWLAFYTMERQADGSWKIAACQIVRDTR
ncbi:MAG: DUF4864 domain-containing protein, partial [Beijerinckiaceae bacterium]